MNVYFPQVLACLDWNILTETGCIVTESHFPLFCEDLFHILSSFKQRKVTGNSSIHSNMRLDFLKISFGSLPACNIMMGLPCVGTTRHLLAHTLREAAMKLGWNTTRTRGGVYVLSLKLTLGVITLHRLLPHLKLTTGDHLRLQIIQRIHWESKSSVNTAQNDK